MNVKLRLIRNDNHDGDDIVVIRKRRDNEGFLIRFTDGNFPRHVWVQEKLHVETMIYVDRILTNMTRDIDPYYSLQVEIPGYPVTLYLVSNLSECVKFSILEMINDFLSKPPSQFIE